VVVEFEENALEAIAKKAIARKTGARGLRGITESIMNEIMYDIPSRNDIDKIIITKETVTKGQTPTFVLKSKEVKEEEHAENAS